MRKAPRNIIFILILAASLFATGCQTREKDTEKSSAKEVPEKEVSEKETSNFKVKTLSGTENHIQNIFAQSELTVVNVWNPSCGTCEDEMKILGALSREYAGKGIQMLGIVSGVSQAEAADSVAMIDSADADYIQLLDSDEIKKEFLSESTELPSTIFIDRNGEVLGKHNGNSMTITEWKDEIEKYHSQVCVNDHPADCGVG